MFPIGEKECSEEKKKSYKKSANIAYSLQKF